MLIQTEQLSILMTVASMEASGGIAETISRMADGVASKGAGISILCLNAPTEFSPMPIAQGVRILDIKGNTQPHRLISYTNALKLWIAQTRRDGQIPIIHDHGMWLPSNYISGSLAVREKVPFVISPHGMLEPWAFAYKGLKKKIAWSAYQRRLLSQASFIQVTAHTEAKNAKRNNLAVPIRTISLGVERPVTVVKAKRNPRQALFLSRLHPKKGLDVLIRAWAKNPPVGWRLVVAGPDEVGELKKMQSLAHVLGIAESISFVGPQYGERKWRLYDESALFILPTKSENFGLVIAEALCSGIPVITTRATPWEELEEFNCGWWIDTTQASLEHALTHATSLSDQQRVDMGMRGSQLVSQRYSWSATVDIQMRSYCEAVDKHNFVRRST